MTVAVIITLPSGFFAANGGASYPFIFFIISLAIFIAGPLKYSLDYLIFSKDEASLNNNIL